MLLEASYPVRGINAVIYGGVPIGAGLSSSAAIEVAFGLAFGLARGLTVPERGADSPVPEGGKRVRRQQLRDHGPVDFGPWQERLRPAD